MRRCALLGLLLVAGCSGAPFNNASPDLPMDLDAGASPDQGAAAADMGARVVPGRRLAAGSYILQGVTRDGWAVGYETGAAGAVVVSLSPGGRSDTFARRVEHVTVDGSAAFAWSNVDPASGAGTLTVWTAAAGARTLDARSPARLAAASPDGAFIAWAANASPDGRTVELRLAKSDGSGTRTLAANVAGLKTDCPPRLRFLPGHVLLFTRCEAAAPADAGPGPDGGAPPAPRATIARHDADRGVTTTLLAGAADFFALDGEAARVLVAESTGRGVILPADGSNAPPIPLDADVVEGLLAADGSRAVFRTSTGALRAAPLQPPGPPVTLIQSGATRLHAVAPDGRAAIFSTRSDPRFDYADLQLVRVDAPAAPVLLAPEGRGALFGDAFTADARHALVFTAATDAWTGTLRAVPVDAPAASSLLGADAWLARAPRDGAVLFNSQYRPVAARRGRADIRFVDLAAPGPPALLVSAADADFFLSPTADALIFSISASGADGIYRLPL